MTSDERREVAARLREDAGCSESSPREVVERYIGVEYDGEDVLEESYTSESLLRLADLIDQTCEIATDQVDDGEWGAHDIYECCSECGNQNMRDRFTGKPYRFCPHCGARVTDGGDSR